MLRDISRLPDHPIGCQETGYVRAELYASTQKEPQGLQAPPDPMLRWVRERARQRLWKLAGGARVPRPGESGSSATKTEVDAGDIVMANDRLQICTSPGDLEQNPGLCKALTALIENWETTP